MDRQTVPGGAHPRHIVILLGLFGIGLAAVWFIGPIPQDPSYHFFADTRRMLGIPNFNDVTSNIGFGIVGMLGLAIVLGPRRGMVFRELADARPYVVFFAGVALVSLGSAYYHWEPSNGRLLWDRLPMSIAFMAFFSAVVADRIHANAGNSWLLVVLVAAGLSSLIYWDYTEQLGRGDLRLYGLVQFYPMLALPVILWFCPKHRYLSGPGIALVLLWYGLSKLLEHFDAEIFEIFGHAVSGHTLKHLAAAMSTFVVFRLLSTTAFRRA